MNRKLIRTLLALLCCLGLSFCASAQVQDSIAPIDTLTRNPSQIAIWPGLGTLGKGDRDSRTDFSFFLLGGRSLENHKLSIAGLFASTYQLHRGVQLSGLANIGHGRVQGAQVAGLYNRADTLSGLQLGLINRVDTVEKGLPIGLISFVKTGYHVIELSFDETFRLNAAMLFGLRKFHSILALGYGHRNEGLQAWYIGYGIGTAPRLGESLSLTMQLSSMWLDNANAPSFNLLNRFVLGLEYMLGDHFGIQGGVQFNGMIYETATSFPAYVMPQRQEPLYREPIGNGYTLQIYPGARLALRVRW